MMHQAYVAPNKHWKEAEMARVMPKQRDATTKPSFIPLRIHAESYIMKLVEGGVDQARIDYPSGVVLMADPMKIADKKGQKKSTAILPLYWVEPGQTALEFDPKDVEVGIVVLFRPYDQTPSMGYK